MTGNKRASGFFTSQHMFLEKCIRDRNGCRVLQDVGVVTEQCWALGSKVFSNSIYRKLVLLNLMCCADFGRNGMHAKKQLAMQLRNSCKKLFGKLRWPSFYQLL